MKIDKNTGALTTSFPIDIPPGRNHLQPDLNLVYNSQNNQFGSIFGEGWSLSIPYIERLNKTGTDQLYSSNYYLSSTDGELASAAATSTGFPVDASGTLTTSLISYWPEENASDTYSTNNLTDHASPTYATGKVNNAVVLSNAAQKYQDGGNVSALNFNYNNPFSVSLWYKRSTLDSGYDALISKGNGESGYGWQIYFNATNLLAFQLMGNAGNNQIYIKSQSAYTDTASWHHLIATYDGSGNASGVHLYIDGSAISTTTFSDNLGTNNTTSTYSFKVGATENTSNGVIQWFGGSIDEVGAWSKALSSQERTDLYNGGSGETLGAANSPNVFGARTENGTFNKYTFANNYWTVTDKNGTLFTYGGGTNSQENDPTNASNTYKWMLSKVQDTNGNSISYNYFSDAGQIYPSSTIYTNTSSTNGILEIDFLRTTSTDATAYYNTGFKVNSNYRISEIDAKVNGSLVRKYTLAYTTGDNATTTLLSSITQSGTNASGTVVTLPAASFSYSNSTPGWGNSTSTWTPPESLVVNGIDNGVVFADVNGDGLPDLLYGYGDGTPTGDHYGAWINNGAGWTSSSTWNPWRDFSVLGHDQAQRLLDVTADGKADMLYAWQSSTGTQTFDSRIDNGHGWTANSNWNSPQIFTINGLDNDVRFADLNGKGMPDVIVAGNSYQNTGSGWGATSTAWALPNSMGFITNNVDYGLRFVDLNGDGLPDLLWGYADGSGNHFGAWINDGQGHWIQDASWNPPKTFSSSGSDTGLRIADVNGDGLPDIIYAYQTSTGTQMFANYLNSGHGFVATSSAWNSPEFFASSMAGATTSARFVDLRGSGLPDIIYNNGGYLNNNSVRADILTKITYPQGGSTSVSYKGASAYFDSSGNLQNKEPYPVTVVSQLTNNDGSINISSSSYQYSGGSYYYSTSSYPFDKQFAGFGTVTKTDSAGNVTKTFYHTGAGTATSTGEYADNFWKIGKPYRVEQYDASSNLFKNTINKWNSVSLGGNAAYVKLDQTLEQDYDGLSTHKDKAEAYSYDTTGNQTQKIQYGQVTGNDDGTFTDTGSDLFTTNTSYATSTTGVIGKPYDVKMVDQNSSTVKESQLYYDTLALGNASLGNLTQKSDYVTSTFVNTQNTYNSYGLITKTLDPRNSTTTYTYDSYNLYPSTSTNALSQSTGYQYDYSTGKPTQVKDVNKNIIQTTFDGLGRPLVISTPDPVTSSTSATSTIYTYTDTANAVNVHRSDYLDASTTVDTYAYYDGLNRLVQTRASAEDTNNYKVADQAYNNIDLVQKESLPYFSSGSSKTTATTTTALFANYTYDPLRRVLTIGNAVGTSTNVYGNWNVTSTDPRGQVKGLLSDAYGNLIQVNEQIPGTSGNPTFQVDTGGSLTTSLIAYYKEENSNDSWTNNYNLTDHASPTYSAGKVNNAVVLSNSGQKYQDGGNLSAVNFNYNSPFSVSLWYKRATLDSGYDALISKGNGEAGLGWQIYFDGSNLLKFQMMGNSGDNQIYIKSQSGYSDTASWHHLIATYDGSGNASGVHLYIDGSAVSVTVVADNLGTNSTQSSYTFKVGASENTSNGVIQWFGGSIDETGVWSKALSSQERTDLYNSGGGETMNSGGTATSTQVTLYTYDGLNNLATSTDSMGNVRHFTYDDLGHRLSAQDLHAATDTTFGTWNYTYDNAGNLTQTVDPNNNHIAYAYDVLNRATSESLGGAIQIAYTYDTCTQGVGKLCVVSSTSQTLNNTYDTRGRISQESNVIGISTYVTAYTYDRQGNQLTITNPDNSQIKYSYNLAGLPETVQQQPNGGSFSNVVSNFDYAPTDQPTTISYANGVTTTNTYDATKLYRLSHKVSALPDTTHAQDMNYTYDADGNITQLADISTSGAGKTVNYVYDGLSRLTQASTTNVSSSPSYSQTFAYDRLGNLTSGPLGTYAYNGSAGSNYADPDAVTGITLGTSTTSYAYDNNGNLTSTGSATSTWNYRNQMTQLVNANGTSNYAYDDQGNRIKLVEPAATTIFPTKFYSAATTGAATTTIHIFANGLLVATIETSGSTSTSRYILPDHLAGTNDVTSASGTLVETLDYYPYGAARLDTTTSTYGGEKRKFIGQYYDGSSGFDYLQARYYDSARGQFVSQDPVSWGDPKGQILQNPQSLNSYSYSEDNPITKSDPKGLQVALGLDDAVGFAIATSPVWVPAIYNGVNAMSTAAVNQFAKWTDTWARSNSRQIQNVIVSSEFGNGLLPDNKPPKDDWRTKAALLGLGALGLGIGTIYVGYQDYANSTPAISVGDNANNLNQGQRNATIIKSPQQTTGPSGNANQGGGLGFSQQQLQSIQNTLNQIKSIINQIQNTINNSSKK